MLIIPGKPVHSEDVPMLIIPGIPVHSEDVPLHKQVLYTKRCYLKKLYNTYFENLTRYYYQR